MHANNFETTENGLCLFFPGRLAGIMVPALPEGEQRMPLQVAGSLISQLLAGDDEAEDLATEEELAQAEADELLQAELEEMQEVEEWELERLRAVKTELEEVELAYPVSDVSL